MIKLKEEGVYSLLVRAFIFLLWVTLQIMLIYAISTILNIFAVYAYWLIQVLSIFIVLNINKSDDNPTYKTSWIILLLIIPLLGVFIYILIKGGFRTKKVFIKYEEAKSETMKHSCENIKYKEDLKNYSLVRYNEANLLEKLSSFTVYKNTSIEYLPIGEIYYEKMKAEMLRAKKYIFIEYFIIAEGEMWQEVFSILKDKVKEGVDVRIIVDQIGSIAVLPKHFVNDLESNGIKVILFNPFKLFISLFLNYRDHRKITVIDGNVAFNGGINIGDEYINLYEKHGHWKDVGVMLKGEGVYSFTLMFLKMWDVIKNYDEDVDHKYYKPSEMVKSNGFVIPYDDSPNNKLHPGRSIYISIISNAQKYIYITTPYLVIDDEIINILSSASHRGVDVKIITPHIPDKKFVKLMTNSNYGKLLKAGVKIYEYTPGFIHGKTFVSDDEVAIVGSINMDFRSFYLQFECATWMCNMDTVIDVYDDFNNTLEKSQEVSYEEWDNRNIVVKTFESFLNLFSPLV